MTSATSASPRVAGTAASGPPLMNLFAFEQVLGTTLELTVNGPPERANVACDAALAELDRLEAIFSRFSRSSELNTWQARGEAELSDDLFALVEDAQGWTERTHRAFHPGAQALGDLWSAAAERGELPDEEAIERVLASTTDPVAVLDPRSRRARKLFPFRLGYDAIAKGRIVDAAGAAAASVDGVQDVLLNVGGDLRHWGDVPVDVAVTDSHGRVDNAAPLATIRLRGGAIATSGVELRGFHVRGRWFPHLIDPRTGRPVECIASATVVTKSCADADVLATACCVLEPDAGLRLADDLGVGLMLRLASGEVLENDAFGACRVDRPDS